MATAEDSANTRTNIEEVARKACQLEAMLTIITIASTEKLPPDGTLLSDYLGACWDISRDIRDALNEPLAA